SQPVGLHAFHRPRPGCGVSTKHSHGDRNWHAREDRSSTVKVEVLRQSDEALLAQYLDSRQTNLVCRHARDFNVTQKEFSCNLLNRETVFTKVQQFGGERSELANLRFPGRDPADCELHRVAGHVMQGASLPQTADNILIVGRKLDDLYSRK